LQSHELLQLLNAPDAPVSHVVLLAFLVFQRQPSVLSLGVVAFVCLVLVSLPLLNNVPEEVELGLIRRLLQIVSVDDVIYEHGGHGVEEFVLRSEAHLQLNYISVYLSLERVTFYFHLDG
jgi:hypothetical protein